MKRLSSVLLLALPFLSGPLGAAQPVPPGVPLLYRSAPTDDETGPAALVARGGYDAGLAASLTDTSLAGLTSVVFERLGADPAAYVYLGFTFTASEPYAIVVSPDASIASVKVSVNGQELAAIGGAEGAFGVTTAPQGSQSAVIRLERAAGVRHVATTGVGLAAFSPCPTLQPVLCGEVRAESPRGLVYDLGQRAGAELGRADLLIPAIVRAEGLHGPVRSDVTLLNRFDSPIRVRLALRSPASGTSSERAVDLAPRSRVTLTDVVRHVLPSASEEQGVLELRGFAAASPGDVTAETYYDGGEAGRIGASLPVFAGDAARNRAPLTVLAAATDGDPRLLLFSSDPSSRSVTGAIVVTGSGEPLTLPFGVTPDRPVSARLSDLFGGELPAGALVTIEGTDPALHAVLVRSDPISGSPRLVSSN